MECDEVRRRLAVWSDGEGRERAVDAHLAECAACAATRAQASRLSSALAQALRHEPPAALTLALMAHARAVARPVRMAARPFWTNVGLAIAAAAAGLALLFWPASALALVPAPGLTRRDVVDALYLLATSPAATIARAWLEGIVQQASVLAVAFAAWLCGLHYLAVRSDEVRS